jgi:hypothetical protein
MRVRDQVSCVHGRPGRLLKNSPGAAFKWAAEVAERPLEPGCFEVPLGDMIGAVTSEWTQPMIDACRFGHEMLRREPGTVVFQSNVSKRRHP